MQTRYLLLWSVLLLILILGAAAVWFGMGIRNGAL